MLWGNRSEPMAIVLCFVSKGHSGELGKSSGCRRRGGSQPLALVPSATGGRWNPPLIALCCCCRLPRQRKSKKSLSEEAVSQLLVWVAARGTWAALFLIQHLIQCDLRFGACDLRDALLTESENAGRQFASLLLHPSWKTQTLKMQRAKFLDKLKSGYLRKWCKY